MLLRLSLLWGIGGLLSLGAAALISPNGGYDVVIGIDESTPPPQNVDQFRENIQTAFELFSNQLFWSTKHRFYIKSVDLLVPNSWELVTAEIATSQAYDTSDFRIAPNYDQPWVVNPSPCGSIGRFVSLPTSFFNQSRISPEYGEISKAILNLFARYRYGVWEEHGEIGNEKFPYFHYKPSLTPAWTFTGCSSEIKGEIETEYGERKECDTLSSEGPGESCRFIPSTINTVNSSITFFPWAPSVSQFCDESTHTHDSPNRQNFFCGHKSIWEVIKESEDYFQTVGKPLDALPKPKFRVVKTSALPLLWILLDTGRTQASVELLEDITASLENFLNASSTLNPDTVVAVGTFPKSVENVRRERTHSYVNEEGAWSTLRDGRNNFLEVIHSALANHDGPVARDFGLALQEVAQKIRVRNHPAGAVILFVKRGATQNGFEQITYFGDVLSSLQEQNIRLYAIEIQQNERTPYVNLERIVSQSEGKLFVINGTTDVREKLDPFLQEVYSLVESGLIPSDVTHWTIHKGFIPLSTRLEIPILDEDIDKLTICVTTKKYILESDIEIRQIEGVPTSFEKSRSNEWGEVSDASRRTVTIFTVKNPPKDTIWEVLIRNCTSQVSDDCASYINANVESKKNLPSPSLQIDVFTSAENNYLDFDRRGAKFVPFSIFAKVELNGQRVLGLGFVEATIVFDNSRYWKIPLLDHGVTPDVSAYDGIYSSNGVFTPPQNGVYKIFVSVFHVPALHVVELGESDGESVEDEDTERIYPLGYLISINQSQFGCQGSNNKECFSAKTPTYLARTVDMTGSIIADNAITFSPRPMRILDFNVATLPNYHVNFTFTSPSIIGIHEASVDRYRIYMSPDIKSIIQGTDAAQLIIDRVGEPPGNFISIEYDVVNQTVAYFAVEAIFGSQKGDVSNVVGAVATSTGNPPVPEPTTTTTTTTTTTSTTSTTTSTTAPPPTTSRTSSSSPSTIGYSTISTNSPTTQRSSTSTMKSSAINVNKFSHTVGLFMIGLCLI